jgi:alcohol dehydrogenase
VDTYAPEGIRLTPAARAAVRDGTDIAARTDMARASLYGGLCLGPVNRRGARWPLRG